MPVDVHWESTPATIGSPCANHVVGVIAKSERLGAGEKTTNATCYNVVKWFAFFVEINHFIEVNNNAVEFAVVSNANGPYNKSNIGVGRNTECLRKWSIFRPAGPRRSTPSAWLVCWSLSPALAGWRTRLAHCA